MSIYNENKQRRMKNIYRIKLGFTTLLNKKILNVIWIPIIILIIVFKNIKDNYISSLNIPIIFDTVFSVSIKILAFLIPIILMLSVLYLIGEFFARKDENCLLLAFDEKDLKKGYPILTLKKTLNNKKVILREIYSNIPLNKWNDKKEDIEYVMNITIIGEIQYSKKNLIQFKSVLDCTPKESDLLYDDI